MSKIDLHTHSLCSDDGELSPSELVAACKAQGIELVAITDHNSVQSIDDAAPVAAATGIRLLSGVELDCTYCGKGFHLLGYCFDHTRHQFAEVEQDILRQEQAAAEEKLQLFCKATGIPINVADTLAVAPKGIVTGELIAELLLSREDAASYPLLHPYLSGGARSDMPNVRFYWDFFAEGKLAYVPIRYIALPDAAALIHSAGGFTVLAHPGQNLAGDDTLLAGIVASGLDGIEAFSSYHSPATAQHYLQLAQQHHLLVTCGSDFHGKHKPNIQLGEHGATWEDERLLTQLSL